LIAIVCRYRTLSLSLLICNFWGIWNRCKALIAIIRRIVLSLSLSLSGVLGVVSFRRKKKRVDIFNK
jgi:hypothetical protein